MKPHLHYAAGILLTTTWLTHAAPAHQHGVATLQVALSDTRLQVELHSPLMNLAGFEGRANTEEQRQALANVKQRFTSEMIQAPQCQLQQASFDWPDHDGYDHDEHDHDEHDHDEHDHDEHDHDEHDHDEHDHDEHDHDEHDEHDHDEHDHDEHGHSDLTVVWDFQCPSTGAITLDSQLITTFPGIETLQLLWITEQQQGADSFDSDQPILLPRP
ncbi:DUF2796 domain-containing protein [Oceanobacter sp. 4_MG-2023]|uniref:ZrgA family zinc uptake protein n=1 Tax=Oceanobacter sp. 4_MG-2023 TaxID=3062623 RepID=UPI002733BB2B|nr:DUF2796 domain-containing protein [Oceanobacter sp. 4_MG-2023]MDP2548776.1 DUF2796 domain-containing protein [Oceanobacter sp. 4_MG-2023]